MNLINLFQIDINISYLILSQCNRKTLKKISYSNKYLNQLVKDDTIWISKIENKYTDFSKLAFISIDFQKSTLAVFDNIPSDYLVINLHFYYIFGNGHVGNTDE